jgi:hypothetical protein
MPIYIRPISVIFSTFVVSMVNHPELPPKLSLDIDANNAPYVHSLMDQTCLKESSHFKVILTYKTGVIFPTSVGITFPGSISN